MHTPILVVMRGYPGTGKSTLARAIAVALHAPLVDRDVIRQKAVDIFGDVAEVGRFSYELMFELVREQLQLGLSVVIDTPLTYRTTYEQAKALAEAFHIPILVVHCQCPPEVQKQRLEGRRGKVSKFQITTWEEWLRWKPRFEEFEDEGYVIDTSNSIDELLTDVMCRIHELYQAHITSSSESRSGAYNASPTLLAG